MMKLAKKIFYILVVLVIALLGAAFSLKNSGSVTVYYYLGRLDLPLSVVLISSFMFGVLLTIVAGSYLVVKLKLKVANLQRRYKNLEQKYSQPSKQSTVQKVSNPNILPIKS